MRYDGRGGRQLMIQEVGCASLFPNSCQGYLGISAQFRTNPHSTNVANVLTLSAIV